MSKQPAFQFYPGDWVQDTRSLSLAAKGAWIDLLCAMWRSQNRGQLTLSLQGYARLIGASVEQTKAALSELIDMQVCNAPGVTLPLHVTESNENVTLVSRRMAREEKERKSSASRVQRWRNVKSNANVTPVSSSSSSLPPIIPPQGGNGPFFSKSKAWEQIMTAIARTGRYGSPDFEDPITAEAVRKIGWSNLCDGGEKLRSRFLEIYENLHRERR